MEIHLPVPAPSVASPCLETSCGKSGRCHARGRHPCPRTAFGAVAHLSVFRVAERRMGRKADRRLPFPYRFDMCLREVVPVLRKVFEQVSFLRYGWESSGLFHSADDSVDLFRFPGGYPV